MSAASGESVSGSRPGSRALPIQERGGQERDVAAPLPKRRHDDLDHAQPVEQVEPERPLLHPPPRDPARGRHDAHVQADRPGAAQAHDLAALDDAQELRLDLHRHRVDLVEENRPPLRRLELARLAFAPGAGERSGGVPEQLALHELPRQRAAVDRDEGPFGPPALSVDGVGDHLLAGAALAQDSTGLAGPAAAARARLKASCSARERPR